MGKNLAANWLQYLEENLFEKHYSIHFSEIQKMYVLMIADKTVHIHIVGIYEEFIKTFKAQESEEIFNSLSPRTKHLLA